MAALYGKTYKLTDMVEFKSRITYQNSQVFDSGTWDSEAAITHGT